MFLLDGVSTADRNYGEHETNRKAPQSAAARREAPSRPPQSVPKSASAAPPNVLNNLCFCFYVIRSYMTLHGFVWIAFRPCFFKSFVTLRPFWYAGRLYMLDKSLILWSKFVVSKCNREHKNGSGLLLLSK